MSQYTTGELAKLCGVSVRTVQYYDSRGILTPSALSEGGRRLYSEADVKIMKIICFLRELDLPLGSIGKLLSEEKPERVISILLEEQRLCLQGEIKERQERLAKLEELMRAVQKTPRFSVESIGDVAHIMENKKKMRKLHAILLLTGIPVGILQWGSIILWIAAGIWWPFVVWACVVIPYGIWISAFYFKRVAYICPECHAVFRPKFRQVFWANHTPNTRKLTCTECGYRGFCVETYGGKEKKDGDQ